MNVLSLADFDWFQGEQLRHDAIAQGELARLPMRRQLVHLTLRLAQHQGRLLKALHANDGEAIQLLITDSFIILLATANTLGTCLRTTGASRPVALSRARTSEDVMSAYVQVVGQMSEACAAFDCKGNFPSHSVLGTSVTTLIRVVIDLANMNGVSLIETIPHRWNQLQRKALDQGKAPPIAGVA